MMCDVTFAHIMLNYDRVPPLVNKSNTAAKSAARRAAAAGHPTAAGREMSSS
jgi:hypothetical protein